MALLEPKTANMMRRQRWSHKACIPSNIFGATDSVKSQKTTNPVRDVWSLRIEISRNHAQDRGTLSTMTIGVAYKFEPCDSITAISKHECKHLP